MCSSDLNQQMREAILSVINLSQGIKGVDLALKVMERINPMKFDSAMFFLELEHLAHAQEFVEIEYTLAKRGATKLRELLATEPFVPTLGAYNGQQAVQHAKAGLKAIYLSGWQVAAAANTSGRVYPDQSLYPVNSVPEVVKEINNALRRADQIQTLEGEGNTDYYLPVIADCEAGFGGALNAYELTLSCIEAGAAAVHFEDQLSSEKKCGHLGGKVLIPTRQAVRNLNAARLAADVAEEIGRAHV